MAKPILLISLKEGMTAAEAAEISIRLERRIDDYHVLVISSQNENTDVKVFYESGTTEVTIEELRDFIKDQIK